jgi:phenylpropionate dioxygenase-like ring-hydroxylating dioxygenase large terminal subunit
MFLRNGWYVAAYDGELQPEPMTRVILGEPVLLYRIESGKPVALEDRCCHRNLPLSMGKREGDGIRCGYHGLKFDAAGNCIEIPGQKEIPPGTKVKAYPLVEKWHFIWIWMGDPAQCDESLLPAWQCLDDARLTRTMSPDGKPIAMQCHWELNNDNLLDLMHVVYVHADTLGGVGLDRYPITTERFQRSVRMMRWSTDVTPPPLLAQLAKYNAPICDRWQATVCEIPSHCTIDAGFGPPGEIGRDGDWDRGVRLRVLITATPETETSSFMFYQHCRNFAPGDQVSAGFTKTIRGVFLQDVAVMEGQQRINSARPDAPTMEIRADVPVLAMRRLVRQFAELEHARH